MSRALHYARAWRGRASARPPFASIDDNLSVNSIEYDKVLQEVTAEPGSPNGTRAMDTLLPHRARSARQ